VTPLAPRSRVPGGPPRHRGRGSGSAPRTTPPAPTRTRAAVRDVPRRDQELEHGLVSVRLRARGPSGESWDAGRWGGGPRALRWCRFSPPRFSRTRNASRQPFWGIPVPLGVSPPPAIFSNLALNQSPEVLDLTIGNNRSAFLSQHHMEGLAAGFQDSWLFSDCVDSARGRGRPELRPTGVVPDAGGRHRGSGSTNGAGSSAEPLRRRQTILASKLSQ